MRSEENKIVYTLEKHFKCISIQNMKSAHGKLALNLNIDTELVLLYCITSPTVSSGPNTMFVSFSGLLSFSFSSCVISMCS